MKPYYQEFELLKQLYTEQQPRAEIPDSSLVLLSVPFQSRGIERLYAHQKEWLAKKFKQIVCTHTVEPTNPLAQIALLSDAEVLENQRFKYWIIRDKKQARAEEVILLFHGLNEKDWTKYLPWAKFLAENTGMAIVLFPIAFHIDRALPTWQQARPMTALCKERTRFFEQVENSSFVNVALSMRLAVAPSRFFLSGLQTYQDVIEWTTEVKEGKNTYISPQANIHFFGFSAGAFLSLILLMANRNGLFSSSKAVLFCGGSLLTGMQLNSKYIMDSHAYQSIIHFYTQQFEQNLAADTVLKQIFDQAHTGGLFFQSMLYAENEILTQMRLNRLQALANQMAYVALAQDEVISQQAIQQTFGNISVAHRVFDFAHEHSHVIPFSPNPKITSEVTQSFEKVFGWIANFFA